MERDPHGAPAWAGQYEEQHPAGGAFPGSRPVMVAAVAPQEAAAGFIQPGLVAGQRAATLHDGVIGGGTHDDAAWPAHQPGAQQLTYGHVPGYMHAAAYPQPPQQPQYAWPPQVHQYGQAPGHPAAPAPALAPAPAAWMDPALSAAHGGAPPMAHADPRGPYVVAAYPGGPAGAGHQQEAPQMVALPGAPGWTYPAPHGYDQHAVMGGGAPASAPPHGAATQHRSPAAKLLAGRRWEQLVPIAAAICFLVAAGFFVADFERMTGRGASKTASARDGERAAADDKRPAEAPADVVEPDAAPSGNAAIMQRARALVAARRPDEAALALDPLIDQPDAPEEAVALHERVHALVEQADSLLMTAGRQRSAGDWKAMLFTLGKAERIRVLTPAHERVRAAARRQLRAAQLRVAATATLAKATAKVAAGDRAGAIAMLEAALRRVDDPRLRKLRDSLAAGMARPPVAAGGGGGGSTPGGTPPRPGGQPTTQPPAAPRTNAPSGQPPAGPGVSNTGGPGAGGVGGGDGHAHAHR